MSLRSWKREFMPTSARRFAGRKPTPAVLREALEHALRKWEGLRPAALEKHGMEKYSREIVEARWFNSLYIDDTSCSLCQLFPGCESARKRQCPLARVRGGRECCGSVHRPGPYLRWQFHDNPEPMIRLLKKALKGLS